MERDYGGLVITLGKDDDDEEFIAEWPEDRPEEDFVFIDTGDGFEEMVRFNLLEVPDELEPGSVAHSSYVESLADDMSAAFAQTGGSDNYWGALMSRVTRTLIRGMTQSGKTCTPVDLAAACSSQDNLEQFADWMNEEQSTSSGRRLNGSRRRKTLTSSRWLAAWITSFTMRRSGPCSRLENRRSGFRISSMMGR